MGNMVQDCSLHYLKAQSDKKKLAYVACEMEVEAGANGQFDVIFYILIYSRPDVAQRHEV